MPVGPVARRAARAALALALAVGAVACSRDADTPGPAATTTATGGGAPAGGTRPPGSTPTGTAPGGTAPAGETSASPSTPEGGAGGRPSPTAARSSRNGPVLEGDPVGCEAASPLLLADIGTGVVTDGVRLSEGFAVQTRAASEDAPATWFVGARIEGPGIDPGAVGVWVTTDPSGEAGLAYAVDEWAAAATDWRSAPATDPTWTTDAPGAMAVRACLAR